MNVVFMGTPEFAVPTLNKLHQLHNVRAVVCQPDKPNKRGNKVVYGAVKSFALNAAIEVLQPQSVKDEEFISKIASYKPNVIVVVAYGKILPREILKIPTYGCINVHASLLPKYRGAAPIQWAVINGETQTGVTIMHMDEGLDSGNMIEKRHVVIEVADTYGEMLGKMATVGAEALIFVLGELANGTAKTIIQNDAEATYAPQIKKEIGHINWRSNGKDIVNLIRGLNPSPGAYCEADGQKLKIWKAEIFGKTDTSADFGTVLDVISDKGIVVNSAVESVVLTEIQSEGGKAMPAPDFLRGRQIKMGTVLK